VACSTLFPTWPNKKGTRYACLKRDLFLFFFYRSARFLFLFFPHFSARSFSFFHPSTHANAQWLCTVCGKNAPAAMRVVSFFPPDRCELGREKCTSRPNPWAAGAGILFFDLVNTHVRRGCAYHRWVVCVCVCKATMGFFVVVD